MTRRLLPVLLCLPLLAPVVVSADDTADRPDPGVLVIAHRGASGLAPEHTLAAYDLALELGADYLEQDAQSTADGVLVSLHDATLDRTARGPAGNCTGAVATKTLAQLRTCEVGSWFGETFAGAPIPTLSEVFARYPDVNHHVEVKDGDPRTVRELLRLLDVHGLRSSAHTGWQVLVQSFQPDDLALARSLDPALPTIQLLAGAPPAGPVRDALLDAVARYADGIGPAAGAVDAPLVEAAHARCLQVHPYTVDDPARLRALVEAGVDGVFTNRPDVLDEVLFPDRDAVRADDAGRRHAEAAAERSRACRG